MKFSWHSFLNIIINLNLALAVASSFFIIQEIRIDGILFPQFFYFFAIIAITGIAIQSFSSPSLSKEKERKISFYTILFFLLLIFFAINIAFFVATTETITIHYYKDLLRVIFLMIFSIAILFHASRELSSLYWIIGALLVPLLITPIIFFARNIDAARLWFSFDFFSGYALQAFQHNQSSLGLWLITAIGIITPFIFTKINSLKRFFVIFPLLVAMMGLIWWTNSRGTILAALLIILISGFFAKWRREITFIKLLTLFISIPILGLLILPSQAQIFIFKRFYPQLTYDIQQTNVLVLSPYIVKNIFSSHIDLLHAQDRQALWPKYILFVATHPFGQFGPAIFFKKNTFLYEKAEHNTILQVGAWGGWGAIIIFVYLLYIIFSNTIKDILRAPSNTLLIGSLMAFIGVFILIFLNSFFQAKTLWFIMTILAIYDLYRTNEAKSFS
ncbi:MAG: hypothetical protein QMD65_00735 [Patescibacteria group bacterium]|nr:hypothetical protein [Patescibacteria group bacterium]